MSVVLLVLLSLAEPSAARSREKIVFLPVKKRINNSYDLFIKASLSDPEAIGEFALT